MISRNKTQISPRFFDFPELGGVGSQQRALAGQVEVVGDDHEGPGAVRGVDPAGGVGDDHGFGAEAAHEQDRLSHEPGRVAFVEVEPALLHDHGNAGQAPEK